MSSDRFITSITKLNGENYHNWKFAVSMALRQRGCWSVVSGIETKPSPGDVEEKSWERKAEDGLTTIALTVDPSQYTYIRECANGVDAWEKLKNVYEKNSRSMRITLKRQFYTFEHDITLPLHHYVNSITDLATKLKGIGIILTDEEIIDVLIFNLHDEYSSVAASLMTSKDELKIADVTSALLEEEQRKGGPAQIEGGIALFGQNGPTNVRTGTHRNCFRCGRPGHRIRECRAIRDMDGKQISSAMEKEGLERLKKLQSETSKETSTFAMNSALNDLAY